jgi:hypothetical protein
VQDNLSLTHPIDTLVSRLHLPNVRAHIEVCKAELADLRRFVGDAGRGLFEQATIIIHDTFFEIV